MGWLIALIIAVVLLYVFPKRIGVVVIATFIAVGLGLYLYVEHQEELRRKESDQVVVKVNYAGEKNCPASHPLSVFIGNTTNRTVNKIEFRVEIRRPGYSDNLVDGYGAGSFRSDKIIKPDEGHSFCHTAPKLKGSPALKDLEYTVGSKNITFAN
jgi:hypothetical protein